MGTSVLSVYSVGPSFSRRLFAWLLPLVSASLSATLAVSAIGAQVAGGDSTVYPATSFVFNGVVMRTRATTMRIIPVSESTVVVRASRVLRVPSQLRLSPGQEVTVLLTSDARIKKGDRATFFADTWIVGDGLAVREVHREPGSISKQLREAVDSSYTIGADSMLLQRLRSADLVVQGTVRRADEPPSLKQEPRDEEHDPLWRAATLSVEAVLRGSAGNEVTFYYPSSTDVLWYDVPKPKAGERAIWLLRKDPKLNGLVLLDPRDRLPVSEGDRVRALLRR